MFWGVCKADHRVRTHPRNLQRVGCIKRGRGIQVNILYTLPIIWIPGTLMTGIQLANYRQGSEIQTCPDLECIGIHNDAAHRIWNGQKMVGFNWSRFRIGSEIRNPNHLKTNKNGHHLVFTIWNLDNLVRIFHESNFQIIETKAIAIDKAQPFEIQPSKSPDFKCFLISNGQISDPHCIRYLWPICCGN